MGIKITDLTALATAPNTADVIAIVDVSDTTQALSGTTKKITIADLGFLSSGDNITELTNNAGYITSSDFSNGGELAGADRDLGNTDAFALSFITNGVGRINIEAGGDVGIGTSTPTEKLDVIGNIKQDGNFIQTATGNTAQINGGTLSTNAVFSVRSLSASASATIYEGRNSGDALVFLVNNNGCFASSNIQNTSSGIGVGRSYIGVGSGTSGMEFIKTNGDVNVGSDKVIRIAREGVTDGGQIHFMNGAGGIGSQISGGTEDSYINSSGNFGIGTTTPSEKLEVVGNALITGTTGNTFRTVGSIAESFRIQSDGNVYFSNTVNNKIFYFGDNGRIQAKVASGNAQLQQFDLFNCGLNNAFAGNNQTINNVNRLSVGSSFVANSAFSVNGLASGQPNSTFENVNVGIGTTTPTEKLEVVGNALITSSSGNALKVATGSQPNALTIQSNGRTVLGSTVSAAAQLQIRTTGTGLAAAQFDCDIFNALTIRGGGEKFMANQAVPSSVAGGVTFFSNAGIAKFLSATGDFVELSSQTNAVGAATFVANTSGISDDSATFGGFTIGQIAQALLNNGLLK